MRGHLIVVALGFGFGCAQDRDFLAWPVLPAETQSVLLGTATPRRDPTIELLETSGLASPPVRVLSFDSDPSASALFLLAYRETAAEFAVDPGPLAIADASECWSRALPSPALAFSADLAGDDPLIWEPLGAQLPASLRPVLYRAPCPCATWAPGAERELEGDGPAVLRSDEIVLFRAGKPSLGIVVFELPDGPVTALTNEAGLRYYAAAATSSGRTFAAATSTDGTALVVEFTEDRRIIPLPRPPLGEDLPDAMVVSPEPPLELFLLTDIGRLLRFDETTGWTVLQDENLIFGGGGGRQSRSMLWLARGEIIASVHNSSAILHTRPGKELENYAPPLSTFLSSVRAFGYAPSEGLVVASYGGHLARIESAERWVMLPEAELGRINGLIAHERGFLAAGDVGWTEIHPDAGVCAYTPAERARPFEGFFEWRGRLIVRHIGRTEEYSAFRFYDRVP